MPIDEQQQRAIVFLAAACRPRGARRWQEPGIAAAVAKIAHLALPEVILAVTRAAADRNAETPGVIPTAGPHWSEGAYQPVWEPNIVPKHRRCAVCSHDRDRCRQLWADDHDFRAATDDLKRDPDAIHLIVEDAKQKLERTKPADEPTKVPPNPQVQAIRQQLRGGDQ